MISIIDYKAGNLTSVKLAFDTLNVHSQITNNSDDILSASHVVFPGVGAARSAMQTLKETGLIEVIKEVVNKNIPFLGICLGTQIIFEYSEENGGVDGIGLINGTVKLFNPSNPMDKVPEMGWNSVSQCSKHPIFEGIENDSEFYFVHSYYPAPTDNNCILGKTNYANVDFASVITKDNLIATQFHPEKSGRIGLKLLKNFIMWDGSVNQ